MVKAHLTLIQGHLNLQKNLKKTLKSKKKVLEEIKEKKYKKKDVSTKEASDFLKNFSKEK